MVPFKGTHPTKQYVKNKPHAWGIKIFVLCGKSGLPYDFMLYQGNTTELSSRNPKEFGFGAAVVLHLSERIVEPGYRLLFDNFFTSFNLLELLQHKNINAAGTCRINRFADSSFTKDSLFRKKPRGSNEVLISTNKKVILVKWFDKKPIHIASNFVGCGNQQTAERWDKAEKKYISIP